MSKAEERALEVYPPKLVIYSDLFGEETLDDNGLKRTVFVKGYHQAEKDLELSWKDIGIIISIDQQVCGVMGISDYIDNHQQAMEEVLKRFKERKEK